jgi:hypothetical protein
VSKEEKIKMRYDKILITETSRRYQYPLQHMIVSTSKSNLLTSIYYTYHMHNFNITLQCKTYNRVKLLGKCLKVSLGFTNGGGRTTDRSRGKSTCRCNSSG